ncbi:YoaM OS=Dictyoglomus thermophilum (strain ATCC 35947 / DSM 3960 / H-6-12) GN=DICTH_0452 PE=4 SV=1: DUF159 [Gemmata massiliana]|uniref:Abasic site processing protein n=1 Tax=Gemmata massiliana TaxID=1210884 RepID=A0A6P2CYV4_9BACT|nr:SOS response-associated peptidase family protein [Gemmata massiliana]VTR94043.1 YoaM OS=Dictyoglomus thermophilum (strain ATCC 35947 / DSM 3960 / H-6-12) GN=DICTH_0452 PE=4 SV=1: DUF159 [Gemmata massiliana]
MLTVSPNELVAFHERMAAILPEEHFAAWLDPKETRSANLLPLLTPYPAEQMEAWPVSECVNRASAGGADLIKPVEPVPVSPRIQPSLFDAA